MGLKQSIGRKTLFILLINGILGTGIYFLPSIGARYAGAESLISWAIMAVVS
ncbi:MAG: hypothetical protein HYW27_02415, partial [Candidatus Aenigmarchaeota archaeon]|nr:hypothetical protein [Candidatus Aenigmarchaeota archaeon]